MSFPYRAEMLTAAAISEQDPFNGHGIRVPYPDDENRESAAAYLRAAYPGAPFIVWDHHAWVDGRHQPQKV